MKRILFYEFSDTTREPIPFHTVDDFNDFCKLYDLVPCVEGNLMTQFNGTNDNGAVKATCLEGTHIVIYFTCSTGPTKYFIERELKNMKAFAEETIKADTTVFSYTGTGLRISCGTNKKFTVLLFGNAPNYSYFYLTDGGCYMEEKMNKCFSDTCDVVTEVKRFQEMIKKALPTD